MKKLYDFPVQDDLEWEKEILVSDDASDDDIERLIEMNRPVFRRAWFEYIKEFES